MASVHTGCRLCAWLPVGGIPVAVHGGGCSLLVLVASLYWSGLFLMTEAEIVTGSWSASEMLWAVNFSDKR